jgi:membrane-anchored protein YejM (alkaline phosphatase superfamily)
LGFRYQPVALPLLANVTVLEQPANLFTIASKYATITSDFITTNVESNTPYFVYYSFNHIHQPNSCGAEWCGQSARGPIGDATEEVDWMVEQVMDTIRSTAAHDNTLVFFTSGTHPGHL